MPAAAPWCRGTAQALRPYKLFNGLRTSARQLHRRQCTTRQRQQAGAIPAQLRPHTLEQLMQRSLAAEAQLLCKVKGDAREAVDHRLPQQKVVEVAKRAFTCSRLKS